MVQRNYALFWNAERTPVAKAQKHQARRLKQRQAAFDSLRRQGGFKRPGSLNSHKNSVPQGRKR